MANRKTKEVKEPPIVNHRWNLPSIEAILDDMLPAWVEGKHPDFSGPAGYAKLRGAFARFAHHLFLDLQWHLEKAAGKGIFQALALIENPDYYETVKRRRSRSIEQGKKWKQKQDEEAKDRERRQRGELTETERIYELGSIAYSLHYHQKEIEKLNARKAIVEGVSPVAFTRAKPSNDAEDSWPDLFDNP